MCGIAGILNSRRSPQATETLLREMISLLRHRGPDACGIYLDPQVGLGHARLSIIGIDGGNQPIGNEAGDLWIVFNGEIFNYIELRQELLAKGYRFATETDTEVLLCLYAEFGAQCLHRLNGQFAFAIWDVRRQELFLARDRVGIRPLFYRHDRRKFVFASEIKALFADREIDRAIDPHSLEQIFTFWGNIAPQTIFRGIRELPPGSWMRVKNGRCEVQSYWQVPFFPRGEERWRGSVDEAAEELRALLKDAVRLRLRADVPVGAYLSGGLDSSIITALIFKYFNRELRTFSLGFQESHFDETTFQKEMADFLGVHQHRLLIDNEAIGDHLSETLWHCEKPLLRTAPIPLFLLSELVRMNGFKVVLTGEGADEVFGGYNIFKEAKVRRYWQKNPASTRRPLLLERLYPYIFSSPSRTRPFLQQFFSVTGDCSDPFFSHRVRWENSRKNMTLFSPQLLAELQGSNPYAAVLERLPADFATGEPLAQAQCLEIETFLSNYLLSSQGDRVGMAHSIELRMPFLDYRIIEFGMRLPAHWKIRGLNEKYLLKRAFRDLIPPNIVNRPKKPYRAPIHTVLLSGKHDYVREALSEPALQRSGLFDAAKVPYLLRRLAGEKSQGEFQNMALIGILSTQIIHRRFITDFPAFIQPAVPDKVIRNYS
jgi:asparagine synthase (glutamine-hydrolysing)